MENLKIFFQKFFPLGKMKNFGHWKFDYSGVRASKNLKPGSWDSLQWALHKMHRRQGAVAIEKTAKKNKEGKLSSCKNGV